MIRIEYTVKLIDGDYAHLADGDGETILIARALLPEATDEGSRLLFEDFVYTLLG
jgi:hypothetical protein